MASWSSTDRIKVQPLTDPTQGRIVFDPGKTLWLMAHIILGLLAPLFFFSWGGLLVCVAITGITICTGHSVGMHRLLIHRSFTTPKWLERVLVWSGTLVGMAGPMGMIIAHDMRDWHQKQVVCPPHPSHDAGFFQDAYWQLCCRYDLEKPPKIEFEEAVASDRFYQFVEKYWHWQQLPLAIILFMMGGIGFVLWGISLRIAMSLIGHWAVGHFAHNSGHQGWKIEGLPVQGYNLPGLGLITFGENWHGNHHAFPHSAKMGVEAGQFDPGYWFICILAALGLARDVNLPNSKPPRQGLTRILD